MVSGVMGEVVLISSILVDDRLIKLNQELEGVPNIFDIDSVSLIIGNNGSGKTFYLNKILDKFTPRAKNDRFSCDIEMSHGRRLGFHEMRAEWGAVYYSPIPYGRRIHSTKNLIDASPNWSKPLSIFDLKAHEDILHEFKISPKVYARREVEVRKICRVIIDIFVVDSFPHVDEIFKDGIATELLSFLADVKGGVGRMTVEQHGEQENAEKKLIESAAARFYHALMDIVGSELEGFCIFAVLGRYVDSGSKGAEVVKAVVDNVFRHRYPPNRAAFKAFDEVENLIRFAKSHTHILKMGIRGFIEAELDPYDSEPLKTWRVEHLLEVGFQNMSSGQLAILAQLSLISDAIKTFSERDVKRVLLLVDEGDAFLHLEWQRMYIGHLNRMLARLKREHAMESIQLILATHSPLLATDVPKEFICRMEGKGDEIAPSAFAAPLHELLSQSFGAKTVGDFASKKINKVVSNSKQGRVSAVDEFVISSIDNPIIKAEVLRRVRGEGGY